MSVISGIAGALGGGGLVGVLGGIAVAAGAMGVASERASASLQSAMFQNVAHAGLAKDQFNAVSDAVLNMAPQVGKGPTELAQSLYPILSGLSSMTDQTGKAQVALAELRLASESVAGSTTSATKAASAGTAVFNALGLQTNSTATNVARMQLIFDQANATITAGNMQWEDYAKVAGKLATAIKGTTVTWTEASAALATMTNEGFTARQSQTYLANLFTQLDLKTDSLAKNAKKLGIAFDEQRFKSMSLAQQMDYLKQITGGNESEVLKLLNNNATALRSYNALELGMNSYKSNLQSIGHAQGTTAADFAIASSSEQAAAGRLRAAFDVLLIRIGDVFLPVVTALENAMTPVVITMANMVQASSWLSFYFAQDLSRATEYLTNKMYLLWDTMSGHGKLLDSFQQTVVWMRNVGTPAYLDFAHVVGDVTGGSYQKLQHDALVAFSSAGHLSFAIGESIAVSLKNINWGAIFAQIPKPPGGLLGSLLGGPNNDILAGLAGAGIGGIAGLIFGGPAGGLLGAALGGMTGFLLSKFKPQIVGIFQGIGSGIMGALQPFIDEWNRIVHDLQPDFAQFGQWWNTTMVPLFQQLALEWSKANDGAQGFHLTLKGVLDTVGNGIEFVVRLGLLITEFVLPPLVEAAIRLIEFAKGAHDFGEGLYDMAQQFMGWFNALLVQLGSIVPWLHDHVVQPIQDKWGALGQWFNDRKSGIWNAITGKLGELGGWFHDHVVQPMQDAWNTGVQWFNNGGALQLANVINNALGSVGQAIDNAFRGPLNWVIDGINRIIDGYNAVPKLGIPNIPDIPKLASGGYISSSGIVDVHANERLFLPAGTSVAGPGSMLAAGSARGGGGGVHYHNYSIVVNTPVQTPADVSRLYDMFEEEGSKRFRSQTPSYSGSAF